MEHDSPFDESIFADPALLEFGDLIPSRAPLPKWATDPAEPSSCVLAAATARDLPELRSWCEQLPDDAYGQVFIEVLSEVQVEPLVAPPGVSVTWIVREAVAGDSRLSALPPRGGALSRAVDAWLDEWCRADYGPERTITIWSGQRRCPFVESCWRRLEGCAEPRQGADEI